MFIYAYDDVLMAGTNTRAQIYAFLFALMMWYACLQHMKMSYNCKFFSFIYFNSSGVSAGGEQSVSHRQHAHERRTAR